MILLITHIAIAITSVVWTTYLMVRPSRSKVKVSYGFIAATLASGTYLVVSTQASMLQACITGLLYAGLVAGATVTASHWVTSEE